MAAQYPLNDWDHYRIACVAVRRGEEDKTRQELAQAITMARDAMAAHPDDLINRFNLALYLLADGQEEEAQTLYASTKAAGPAAELVQEAIWDLEALGILRTSSP